MTTTIAPADKAYGLIDEALSDMAGVNVVEASKMTDLLLDLRLLLAQIVGSSDD